ncbi:flavin reductase family protein [Paenibacillus marchantiae]|uniref:flavin reductase family protein n=1 Tax=Paenibacillus marchantiae TaxID=3026433 RepID=UPI00237A274F|nr:flavin reductase family protein [Paenibacillus marchantiae]WDQ34914.1 flavin reductase family protein [Paenibacillus marchantiae]
MKEETMYTNDRSQEEFGSEHQVGWTSELIQHEVITPSILYYGTPVLLLSTLNEDGTTNLSPLSSSWALGDCLVLGVGIQGKAFENLSRHPECVINLPDASMWEQVEGLGRYTGIYPVPEEKRRMGFEFCDDKFAVSGLTPQSSVQVEPDKIEECPLQIEAAVQHIRIPEHTPFMAIVEVKALKVHAHTRLISGLNKINPEKWNPLIYNFRHYYGLGERYGESFRAEK